MFAVTGCTKRCCPLERAQSEDVWRQRAEAWLVTERLLPELGRALELCKVSLPEG